MLNMTEYESNMSFANGSNLMVLPGWTLVYPISVAEAVPSFRLSGTSIRRSGSSHSTCGLYKYHVTIQHTSMHADGWAPCEDTSHDCYTTTYGCDKTDVHTLR